MIAPRIDGWLNRRLRPEAGPVRLTSERVYIMPDQHGILFGIVLTALLLGSLNFSLSLGFVLTFLLAGIFLVAIFHTYRNLLGLAVTVTSGDPVFAGGQARFVVGLSEEMGRTRHIIGVEPRDHTQPPVFTDLAAHQGARLPLYTPAVRRGWLTPGRVRIFTRFPLGVIVAWGYVEPEVRCLVYPRPEAAHPPLPRPSGGWGEGRLEGEEGEEFAGLRPYRDGDPLRHVHWKAAARQEGLLVKQFAGQAREELWLDWQALATPDPEARLSHLCRWVLDAELAGVRYGLRLPNRELPPHQGEVHQRRCLEALALFGMVP